MVGDKKLPNLVKLLNIGYYKTVGVMIGVRNGDLKDSLKNKMDISEFKEVWIPMVSKVFLRLLFLSLLKLNQIVLKEKD